MEDIITAFLKLRESQPRAALYQILNHNSRYTNYTDGLKNCYLVANAFNSEDCFYGRNLSFDRDCVDCDFCHNCELCCQCVNCNRCYNGYFLQDCENCIDSFFGYDLKGCRNCFGCVSLRQKEYFIFNEPYKKEQYLEKILILRSSIKQMDGMRAVIERFTKLKESTPRKFAAIQQCEHVFGDHINCSKNCWFCFDIDDCQDCIYGYELKKTTDSMDITIGEFSQGNYECQSAWKLYNSKFCNNCWESSDLEYCDQVFRSQHCFFCVYLNHCEYHILNKPYSREDYLKKTTEYKNWLKAQNLYNRWFIPSAYPIKDTCILSI